MAKRFIIKVKDGDKFAYLKHHHKNDIMFTMAIDDARLYKTAGFAKVTIEHNKKKLLHRFASFADVNNVWGLDHLAIQIIPVKVEVYAASI